MIQLIQSVYTRQKSQQYPVQWNLIKVFWFLHHQFFWHNILYPITLQYEYDTMFLIYFLGMKQDLLSRYWLTINWILSVGFQARSQGSGPLDPASTDQRSNQGSSTDRAGMFCTLHHNKIIDYQCLQQTSPAINRNDPFNSDTSKFRPLTFKLNFCNF